MDERYALRVNEKRGILRGVPRIAIRMGWSVGSRVRVALNPAEMIARGEPLVTLGDSATRIV